jgi:hypothetical protein
MVFIRLLCVGPVSGFTFPVDFSAVTSLAEPVEVEKRN